MFACIHWLILNQTQVSNNENQRTNFNAKSYFTFRKQISKLKLTLQHQMYVTSIAWPLSLLLNKCFQQDQYSCLWKTLPKFWFKYQMMNTQKCSKMFKQSKFKDFNFSWMCIVHNQHQFQFKIIHFHDDLLGFSDTSMWIWCYQCYIIKMRNIS